MRVLLADDHPLVRAGIRELLSRLPGVELVGKAVDGRGAVEMTGNLHPVAVFMDISMPGMSGIEATREIRARGLETRIVALSLNATNEHVSEALHADAAAYVVKDGAAADLSTALAGVMRGERFISPEVSRTAKRRQTGARPRLPSRTGDTLGGPPASPEHAGEPGVSRHMAERQKA